MASTQLRVQCVMSTWQAWVQTQHKAETTADKLRSQMSWLRDSQSSLHTLGVKVPIFWVSVRVKKTAKVKQKPRAP